MAYSYEGVSTHPSLRIKQESHYVDKYGSPHDRIGSGEESFENSLALIRNREPLPTFPSKRTDWNIGSLM